MTESEKQIAEKENKKNSACPFLKKKDHLILLLIALLYLATHLPGLTHIPHIYGEEQYYVPAAISYLDMTTPDENIEQPPLAKLLIAASIKILGNNPMGWRAGSLVFGLLIIIVTYFLGISLFNNRPAAIAAALLVNFDFLHFVQSRMAMLDVFSSFFILGSLFFAWRFTRNVKTLHDTSWKELLKNRFLIAGAVYLGLAVTCKLNGVAGFVASLLFFAIIFTWKEKRFPLPRLVLIAGFYLAVMTAVFIAAHIPAFLKGVPFTKIFYREAMLLHYTMPFEHQQLAPMWKWPLLLTPFWHYYVNDTAAQTLTGIIAWGNFVFWWGFLGIFLYQAYRAFKYRREDLLMVVVGYLGLFLFWLVSFQVRDSRFFFKGGFFYYMLPMVPFMALAVAEIIGQVWKTVVGKINTIIYFLGILFVCMLFYPLLTAQTKPYVFFDRLFGMDPFYLILAAVVLNAQLFFMIIRRTSTPEKQ